MLFDTVFVKQEADQVLKMTELTREGRLVLSFLELKDYLKLKMLCKSIKRCVDVPIIQLAQSNPDESADMSNFVQMQDVCAGGDSAILSNFAKQEAFLTICPNLSIARQLSLKDVGRTDQAATSYSILKCSKIAHKQITSTRLNFIRLY